jgi:hypothetical protein
VMVPAVAATRSARAQRVGEAEASGGATVIETTSAATSSSINNELHAELAIYRIEH